MSKPKPVPGKVIARKTRDGQWSWKWTTPTGTPHLGVERFDTEAKAMTAGRRFARKNWAGPSGADQ
ncbi:hypothetical protein SEA_TYPHA_62 [Mycobacterium phage Typha]|uniref:Uncharacterized protein n=1 Tax=Mycobacterium phage Typha TaxID=2517971 RepID=A0A482J6S9_9CAUD|nr:hypothetical protein KCH40_gp107 [Mycobacterium phage Typha]QBP29717.1 hypothetical protein SEA_TYPHA_62 [Mycobacterium phage Typha]